MMMNATNPPEILLQHGNDHVLVKFIPNSNAIYVRKIDPTGATIPNSQEIINMTEHPGLECLHDGRGWYPPLLVKVLRFYDDQQEDKEPRFQLTAKGKRALRNVPSFVKRHYSDNEKGQTHV